MMRLLPRVLIRSALCAVNVFAQAGTAPAPVPASDKTPTHTVTATDAWARATAPGMSVGAVYLTLQGGAHADSLIAASTARAGMTQIHVVTEADGMARPAPQQPSERCEVGEAADPPLESA